MEPPIQGLNLRSMVLLLAMSFSLMLWGERGAGESRHLASGKGQGWGREDWEATAGRGHSGGQNVCLMCGKEEGLGPEGLSQDWSPGPWPGVGSYRWSLLGKLSIEPVSEALEQRVPTSDNDTAVQALRAGRRSEQSRDSPSPPPASPGPLCQDSGLGLTGRMSMSHMPMLVVTTWPTPSMVFPERPCRER